MRDDEDSRRKLLVIADECLDELVASSPPRFTVLWQKERSRFHQGVLTWLAREAQNAARSTPMHFEVSFGPARDRAEGEPHSVEPLAIDLGDGRTLQVSGKIDRIDKKPDGTLVLRDYKTGRAPRDDGGMFRGGRQLQIPFYLLAAERLFPGAVVTEAFLDYVDGGRQVSLDTARAEGGRVPRAPARAGGRHRPGPLRPGAHRVRMVRLHRRVRAAAAARAAAALQDQRPAGAAGAPHAGRGMSTRPVPVDEDARERARRDHGTSLVIEAGAGTGKTTLLIDRIEALLRAGTVRLDQIAAVTFTENAATTMKLRLRERLEKARLDPAASDEVRQRAGAALETIERAQISTIHALCAAILGERPLECGVVPGFRTADEAESELLFAEAWDDWLTEALLTGHEAVLAALDQGIPLEAEGTWERGSLRGLARTLVEQRDLRPLVAEATIDPEAWRRELMEKAGRARELAVGGGRRRHAGSAAHRARRLCRGDAGAFGAGPAGSRWPRCPPSRAASGRSRAGLRRRR